MRIPAVRRRFCSSVEMLLAYHIRTHQLLPENWIPALYAVAMGAHAVSALGFGVFFDRVGRRALLAVSALSVPVAPLAFCDRNAGLFAAMALAGLAMGAQKAMFKATVAQMAPAGRRGVA